LSPSWARPIQSTPPHPISTRSILMLSTHLCLDLPSGLLPSVFPYHIYCINNNLVSELKLSTMIKQNTTDHILKKLCQIHFHKIHFITVNFDPIVRSSNDSVSSVVLIIFWALSNLPAFQNGTQHFWCWISWSQNCILQRFRTSDKWSPLNSVILYQFKY
jgi:hypothetical protein